MSNPSLHPPTTCQSISDAFEALHENDGFAVLPPSSLLHESVPMSFVMSAGLIQVENDLDQIVEDTGGRFVFTQPCFRHFDVKQVGLDTTHLSLFHMSAAFYIGCSERKTVLPRLWHFLTNILQLEKERLWITYLDDEEFGRDQRTHDCWLEAGVDSTHLIGLDQGHCFWRQRSTGQIARDGKKCGPHTEVFVERDGFECGEHCVKGNPGACRCGRFVEVSNSLFIENYISGENKLIPADTVFAECVIGIERLGMVLQSVDNVQRVDRFNDWRRLLVPCSAEQVSKANGVSLDIAIDHLSAFEDLIRGGAPPPGHGGRRYIMKRLLRDGIEHLNAAIPEFESLFNEPNKLLSEYTKQLVLKEIERRNNMSNKQLCTKFQ